VKTKYIQKQLEKATKHLGISDSACGAIASELQPFFEYEISVMHQMSDGFVVYWECDNPQLAPHNVRVEDVLEDLKRDVNSYR
jgi:hypothetical protein